MSHDEARASTTEPTAEYQELIAYLDGELDENAQKRLELRLARDPHLRQRLQQYQSAWRLLDELPREPGNPTLTATTLEMVSLTVAQDLQQTAGKTGRRRWLTWSLTSLLVLLAALLGYVTVTARLTAPHRALSRDLPVIKHLDEYRYVDDIEFLRQLADEQLFALEDENDAEKP